MRVLSIDLDYICEPAINHNNIDVRGAEENYDQWPVLKWWQLFNDFPGEFKHDINIEYYHYCLRVYLRALRNCREVYFGYDHDNILYGLEGHTDIDIINIDHHDDVFSGAFRIAEGDDSGILNSNYERRLLEVYDRVMEGNWSLWLHTKGRLSSYTWIGDDKSENVDHIEYANRHLPNFTYSTMERYDWKDNYEFDQIFICLSPAYIPPLQWHMFGTFMTIYEEITGKKINKKDLHKKYELEYYYHGCTEYITKGTGIGEGSSAPRIIY